MKFLISVIATFFGVGKIPFMPGTFGSLAATILVAVIFYQPYFVKLEGGQMHFAVGGGYINPQYIIWILSISSLVLWFVGYWASDNYASAISKKDPSEVVIDEVAGVFVAFSLISIIYAGLYFLNKEGFIIYLTLAGWAFLLVFILFRIFDILKPLHVGWADKNLKGGLGIMADDIIAGGYTAIAFYAIFFALKFLGILDKLVSVE